jgi:hypothetical protein
VLLSGYGFCSGSFGGALPNDLVEGAIQSCFQWKKQHLEPRGSSKMASALLEQPYQTFCRRNSFFSEKQRCVALPKQLRRFLQNDPNSPRGALPNTPLLCCLSLHLKNTYCYHHIALLVRDSLGPVLLCVRIVIPPCSPRLRSAYLSQHLRSPSSQRPQYQKKIATYHS